MAETCHICSKEKGQPPDRCSGHYMMPTATPIEAALRKVQELREVERKMFPSPWRSGFGGEPMCVGHVLALATIADLHQENFEDAAGIAALRNAAPMLLDLLEALLHRHDLGADYWEYGGAANKQVEAALAAFMEGKDAAD